MKTHIEKVDHGNVKESNDDLKNYFIKSFKEKVTSDKREKLLLLTELDAILEGKEIVLSNAK